MVSYFDGFSVFFLPKKETVIVEGRFIESTESECNEWRLCMQRHKLSVDGGAAECKQ